MSHFKVDKPPPSGAVNFRGGSPNTFPYGLGNGKPPAEEDPAFCQKNKR